MLGKQDIEKKETVRTKKGGCGWKGHYGCGPNCEEEGRPRNAKPDGKNFVESSKWEKPKDKQGKGPLSLIVIHTIGPKVKKRNWPGHGGELSRGSEKKTSKREAKE